ncbi:isocitrate lyase/PEP mutase family protein [Clostridium sp. 'White wine YQ']|uniref:isocitrate lyase/PEP mutase family protein n=1 Tax=Clostridium sp. 'White wine YQ' TaxID=3027474 RepID=UPI0023670CEE|nr:isocitrate lyase/phosphoenolpyruvate mutase family protein [Clostridium sp. 'White wine YQ']MDD7793528.1 isocitrate lyase/phosphoenolpyruvate mutase family protein [Clostridium sp. 'White wine YQ']
MDRDRVLKELLNSGNTIIMPDAYDGISAKIIEYAGFPAVQCSGYSFSIAKGYMSEEDIDLKRNLKITKEIVDAVNIPVIADAEDGYGDGEYFSNVIEEFIGVGVSGINIEDLNHQMLGDTLKIYNESVMLEKIDTVKKIKKELSKNDFILNARTDALKAYDNREKAIKVAIERANKYIKAGADICFVAYVKTLDEIKLLAKEIDGPISIAAGLPYNIQEFSINDCIDLGISRVSLPTFMILNSIEYMSKKLIHVKKTGSFLETVNDNTLLSNLNTLDDIIGIKKY